MQGNLESQSFYERLTSVLTETDQFKPEYRHLDSENFLQLPPGEFIVICSRPFSNINTLNLEIKETRIETVVEKPVDLKCGFPGCRCVFRDTSAPRTLKCVLLLPDPEKLRKVRQTFNGPALISSLLPPVDHLMGRIGHPALLSGKPEAWKLVCGKVESVQLLTTQLTELRANPKRKEQAEYDEIVKQRESEIRESVLQTLVDFEKPRSYPGGTKELFKRCFSVYIVKRDDNTTLVEWKYDMTHKNNNWSEKSNTVTTPLLPYTVIDGIAKWA